MMLLSANDVVVVRLDKGEDVISMLCAALEQSEARCLFIASAVGALSEVKFGVYDMARDAFDPVLRSGFLEVVSLAGNVVRRDGKPFAHLHAVCSNPDLTLFGGHVLSARCGLTMEISLLRSEAALERARLPGLPATYLVCATS